MQITLNIPDALAANLSEFAEKMGMTRHKLLVEIVNSWLRSGSPVHTAPPAKEPSDWPVEEMLLKCPGCHVADMPGLPGPVRLHCNGAYEKVDDVWAAKRGVRIVWHCNCPCGKKPAGEVKHA
jgi:hypothetical protein